MTASNGCSASRLTSIDLALRAGQAVSDSLLNGAPVAGHHTRAVT